MIDLKIWKKAWSLLDARERRSAWGVLIIVTVAAISAAIMVGSVMPFLSVLAAPERINTVPALAWAYQYFDFKDDYSFLVALGISSLLIIVVANLFQIFRFYAVTKFALMRMHTISYRLLNAFLGQSYEEFIQQNSGEMSSQILAESQQVVEQFFKPAAEAVASLLTLMAIFSLLMWIDPIMTPIVFLLVAIGYGGIFLLIRKKLVFLGNVRLQANQERYRIANEALGGVKEIMLMGHGHHYVKKYSSSSKRLADTLILSGAISQIPQYIMQTLAFGGIIVLTLVLLSPEALTSGSMLGDVLPILGIFAFAGQRMFPELSKLYVGITQLQYGGAAVDAVQGVSRENEKTNGQIRSKSKALGLRCELLVDAITYNYPGTEKSGISNATFSVKAGEWIGIVGTTGSGKTTLADLMLGLLTPTDGAIFVDGVKIGISNRQDWQQSVAYVPQDIFLTDSDIASNIAFGVPPDKIDFDQVRSAAKKAQLESFIDGQLADGFRTIVGERGVRLSGGQRQRIGIARALYHDADLILFDEATSALDNATEHEVIEAIEALPGDKTVIMIAHRLSTVKRCDRLVMLDAGKVIGYDNWQGLWESSKEFKKIASSSEGGY